MKDNRKAGTVRRIELDDGCYVHGIELLHPFMVFVDTDCDPISDLETLPKRPILFVLAVIDQAVDGWKDVGHIEITPEQIPIPDRYMQSLANPSRIHRVDVDFNSTPATYEEVKDLEKAMVWSRKSIEERLEDHYAGKANRVWQRTRPVKPTAKPEQATAKANVNLLANDDARDWFHELQYNPDPIGFIEQTVHQVHSAATRGEYVDIDRCRWMLAAGVLMATVHGESSGTMPKFVPDPVDFSELKQRDDLLDLITQMLRMVAHGAGSELREVWENSEGFEHWLSSVDELTGTLSALSAALDE